MFAAEQPTPAGAAKYAYVPADAHTVPEAVADDADGIPFTHQWYEAMHQPSHTSPSCGHTPETLGIGTGDGVAGTGHAPAHSGSSTPTIVPFQQAVPDDVACMGKATPAQHITNEAVQGDTARPCAVALLRANAVESSTVHTIPERGACPQMPGDAVAMAETLAVGVDDGGGAPNERLAVIDVENVEVAVEDEDCVGVCDCVEFRLGECDDVGVTLGVSKKAVKAPLLQMASAA